MPSYMPGELIKEIRMRKKWQQAKVLTSSIYADLTLSRIENLRQKPNSGTMLSIMESLKMPVEQFFCPFLENQSMDTYILRDQLINCLDSEEDDTLPEARLTAERLIKRFESMEGFNSGINLQFILSCKARLYEMQCKEPSQIIALVREGLAITFPEFDENSFAGEMLIFEEIELLHTLALVYDRMGNLRNAVKLLHDIQEGLVNLPEDDHEKEKKLVKVLLTLSRLLIKVSEFGKAMEICELGNNASIKRKMGKYTPNFLYNKALCLFNLGRADECPSLLHQAYFGYEMLHKRKQAQQIRESAGKIFGITIETYSAEEIEYEYPPPFVYFNRGEPAACKDIGSLIAILRVKASMSQRELSQGICSISNLCKIENGEIQPQVYYLEAFMQRLGRDINLYVNTFLSANEFEAKQMRDEVNARLILRRYKQAAELLAELETKKSYKTGVNLQFIKSAKASIISSIEGNSPNYIAMLSEGLKITRPDFDEQKIAFYRLTYYEIILINKMAAYLSNTGELARGVKIYEQLRESMNITYVDELEKIRMYDAVLYNYSKYLGIMERHKEALEIVSEGEVLSVKHGRLIMLPSFAVNKACAFLELGRKKESVPYFAQAYYGAILLDETANQMAARNYVKKHLGIILN